jgi:hypothetical protein
VEAISLRFQSVIQLFYVVLTASTGSESSFSERPLEGVEAISLRFHLLLQLFYVVSAASNGSESSFSER